jgi:hypothetical protein
MASDEWRVAFAVNAFLTAETQKNNKRKKSLHSLRLCGKKNSTTETQKNNKRKNPCGECISTVYTFLDFLL